MTTTNTMEKNITMDVVVDNHNEDNTGAVEATAAVLNEVRYFSIVSYACLHDIMIVLNEHVKQIEGAYTIKHDKEECENHYHIDLWLKYGRRSEVVRNWFRRCMDDKNQYANTLVQHTKNCQKSYEYLTHKNHQNKYQYDEKDIIVFGRPADEYILQKTFYHIKYQKEQAQNASYDRINNLIDELISGVPFRMMINNYGRDFVINYRRYCEMAAICCIERFDLKNAGRLAALSGNKDLATMIIGDVNNLEGRPGLIHEHACDVCDDILQYDYEADKTSRNDYYGGAINMIYAQNKYKEDDCT